MRASPLIWDQGYNDANYPTSNEGTHVHPLVVLVKNLKIILANLVKE
jgi:hypothetical protein